MGFGGEVANGVDAVVREDLFHGLLIADVGAVKEIAPRPGGGHALEIFRIPGVGQGIDVDDPPLEIIPGQ